MTQQQTAIAVTQMHAIALTIAEIRAVGTLVTAHPFTIPVREETTLPNIHKVIVIDITLVIVAANTGTC
jgi:hypothetical protein